MFIVIISRGTCNTEIMVCMNVAVGVIVSSCGVVDVLRYMRCWGDSLFNLETSSVVREFVSKLFADVRICVYTHL